MTDRLAKSTLVSRRGFIKRGAIATAAALSAPSFIRARNANEKLNIAMIGSGGRGAANLKGVESENIVALCDVFTPAVDAAAKDHPEAKRYTDFRKLFDNSKDF